MIEAEKITKNFGNLEVLKGIDFHVDKAQVVSIVGASGAGKSTFLQILGTLMSPDSGSIIIDGIRTTGLSGKRLAQFRNAKLGFVFQFHNLLPEFTAVENVMIPSLIDGKSEARAREAARRLMDLVGLSGRLNHKPSELSGGEQQRVAIARALVNSPAVLLADEPTGNLDSKTKEEIHKLIFDLRDTLGQTTVIVTHDESLAGLCDRRFQMKDGLFI